MRTQRCPSTPRATRPRRCSNSLTAHDLRLDDVEVRESIKPVLDSLSAHEKQVLMLKFFRNKTQTEIAAELGVSQMQVSRLLNRSLTSSSARRAGGGLAGQRLSSVARARRCSAARRCRRGRRPRPEPVHPRSRGPHAGSRPDRARSAGRAPTARAPTTPAPEHGDTPADAGRAEQEEQAARDRGRERGGVGDAYELRTLPRSASPRSRRLRRTRSAGGSRGDAARSPQQPRTIAKRQKIRSSIHHGICG